MQRKIKEDIYGLKVCVFPSGRDSTEYSVFKLRDWAWQFLRRREDYINSCDEIRKCKGTFSKKALIKKHCEKFRLKKYKPFTSKRPPRFNISAIDAWDHMSNDTQPLKRKIKKGDVIIRFNIKTEFNSEKSFNKQLNNAKNALLNKSRDYGFFVANNDVRTHDKVFLKLLRLLDLLRYQKLNPELSTEELCDFLYGAAGWNDKEFNNNKKSAYEYLDKYLELATVLK